MLKKAIYITLFLLIVGTIAYLFILLPKFGDNKFSLFQYIPSQSILIIRSNSPQKLRANLEKASAIWQKLQAVDIFNLINELLNEEADLVDRDESLRKVLDEKPISITIQKIGDKFEPLVFLDIEDEMYLDRIEELYNNEKRLISNFEIDGDRGFVLEDRVKRKWYAIIVDHVLIISFDKLALTNCLRDINQKKTLFYDKGFDQVKSSSLNTDLVCMINNKEIYLLNNYLFKPAYFNRNIWSVKYQDWTTVDFTFSPNEIKFSSIWEDKDSNTVWHSLKKINEDNDLYLKYIPQNTFGFSTILFEDYASFYDKAIEQMDLDKQQNHNRYINELVRGNKPEFVEQIKSMIQGRFIKIKTKADSIGFSELGMMELSDSVGLVKMMISMSDSLVDNISQIYLLRKEDVFNKLCFQYLQTKSAAYAMIQWPYLVLSSNTAALRNYKSMIQDNKNMSNDSVVHEYLNTRFNKNSMFFAFERWHNLEFSKMEWLNEKNYDRAREYMKFLKLMDFSGIQVAYKNNQLIMQGNIQTYVEHENVDDYGLTWRKYLDAPIKNLKTIYNHKTQSNDLFVVDNSNTVYLYNSNGMLSWKQNIGDSIIGGIKTIDWYKNSKTQILFNTSSAIHCFDINGKYLKGFPIKITDTTVNEVSMFDYDNDFNYRFLYVNTNNQLKNLTIAGSAVGFKSYQFTNKVSEKVKFLRADAKDHLMILDTIGQVYLLDRKANIIKQLRNKVRYNRDSIAYQFSNRLANSYILSIQNGKLVSLSLADVLDEKKTDAKHANFIHHSPQTFLLQKDDKSFKLMDFNNTTLFDYKSESTINSDIFTFYLHDTLSYMFTNEDKSVHLLSTHKNIKLNRFPSLQNLYYYEPSKNLRYFIKADGNQLKCFYFQEFD